MIKAIIVDDELVSRESLEYLLKKIPDVQLLQQFSSAIEARDFLGENNVDVIFLDVEMPDLTGMEFLATVSDLPTVILTTSNPAYAAEAFEHRVLDYIVKPVNLKRLNLAMERIREERKGKPEEEKEGEIYVRSDRKFLRLEVELIAFVETMDDYLIIHMKSGEKHITHSTLSNMEDRLPESSFQKVHRSYIVNLSAISSIEEAKLNIGRAIIPISRAFRPVLKSRLGL